MQDKVFEQQITHLYSHYEVQNIGGPISIFVVGFIFWKPDNVQTILVWGALFSIIMALRFGCSRLYKNQVSRFTAQQWGWLAILFSLISALLFVTYLWLWLITHRDSIFLLLT